jgi:hypothetical protein
MFFFSSLKWITSCLLILLISCLQGEEKLFCPMDARTWKIGFQAQNENENIVELILQNDDINHWSELFTVQQFDNLPVSATEFVAILEKTSKENTLPHQTLRFQVLKPHAMHLFESSFISQQKENFALPVNDEYNIGRILEGKSTLYYLRYSAKDVRLFEQNKESWIERLKLAYVASEPRPNQQGRWFSFTSKQVYDQGQPLAFQSPYQFIENHEMGFGLSIPKNWKVDQRPSPLANSSDYFDSLYFFDPNHSIEGKIAILDLAHVQAPFQATVHYFNLYKVKHPEAQLVSRGKIQTILGQEGSDLVILDGEKKGWISFLSTSNHIYRLELWTEQKQFESLKSRLETIIANFQIFSSQSL